MKHLRIAFNVLTTLPFRAPADWQPGDHGRAAVWFPFVGLVIGALVAGAQRLLDLVFPPSVAGALALALWVLLTGGMHLDGLADSCDGLFHPSAPERRLEIMKDPRVGSFGAIGLVLALLIKGAALVALPSQRAVPATLLAASLARWMVILAGLRPPARGAGMGFNLSASLKPSALIWGGLIPLGALLAAGVPGVIAALAALLAAFALLAFARARIGGVTGDVFGLLVETTEIIILTVMTL